MPACTPAFDNEQFSTDYYMIMHFPYYINLCANEVVSVGNCQIFLIITVIKSNLRIQMH